MPDVESRHGTKWTASACLITQSICKIDSGEIHDGEDDDRYVVAEDDNGYKLVLKES
jgi:hypothetical protein